MRFISSCEKWCALFVAMNLSRTGTGDLARPAFFPEKSPLLIDIFLSARPLQCPVSKRE
jgi:hypothetical protein